MSLRLASLTVANSLSAGPADDLLGDDNAVPNELPDDSAEIGNKRNQLSTTSKGLENLQKSRQELEGSAKSVQDELSQLETDLSNARVKHEAETKAVTDLRSRVSEQKTKVQNLRGDVIAAESDLSGMRSEKDELEQALLRDKEEIRSLQKKMTEVNDEKTTLKTFLEKLRKEARQQKGMVTIAKKQLTTSETVRDGVQRDIDNLATSKPEPTQEAAAVPLPATPKALSPNATGMSSRSNNPFDRLGGPRPESRSLDREPEAAAVPLANVTEPPAHPADIFDETPHNDPFEPTGQREMPGDEADAFGVTEKTVTPSAPSRVTDFDSAFADFDDEVPASTGPEQTTTAQAPPSPPHQPQPEPHITASPEKAVGFDALEDPEHQPTEPVEELLSSDDEEGPEDVETPTAYSTGKNATSTSVPAPTPLAEPLPVGPETVAPPTRRSAPAPPTRNSEPAVTPKAASLDAESAPKPDILGAMPEPKMGNFLAGSAPKMASFDDDDFDFTDQPPTTMEASTAPEAAHAQSRSTAFDDEFAMFDDEFDNKSSSQPNTGSDNSNLAKSYEIVSPQIGQPEIPAVEGHHEEARDEWGMASTASKPAAPALSFDDAFGGGFEPAPAPSASEPRPAYEPPSGPPPGLKAPPPPERRPTEAQLDDLEDVKKVMSANDRKRIALIPVSALWYGLFPISCRISS